MITSTASRNLGVDVGEVLELPSPSGTGRLVVLEVVELLTSTEGLVAVPHATAGEMFGEEGLSWLEVFTDAGTADVVGAVRGALRTSDGPQAFAFPGDEHYEGALAGVRQSAAMFTAMQVAISVAAAIAVANTMVIAVNERRRELGVLRAIGGPRSTLRRMVLDEAVGYGAVGFVLGAVLGVLQYYAGLVVVGVLTGTGLDPTLRLSPFIAAAIAVSVIVVVAGIAAGRSAVRGDVEAALRWE